MPYFLKMVKDDTFVRLSDTRKASDIGNDRYSCDRDQYTIDCCDAKNEILSMTFSKKSAQIFESAGWAIEDEKISLTSPRQLTAGEVERCPWVFGSHMD